MIPALLFPISSPDYTNLGMPVLCGNFLTIRGPCQDAICGGIMPRSHIHIKPACLFEITGIRCKVRSESLLCDTCGRLCASLISLFSHYRSVAATGHLQVCAHCCLFMPQPTMGSKRIMFCGRLSHGRIHRVGAGGTCPSQTQDVLKLFKSVCTNVDYTSTGTTPIRVYVLLLAINI